MTPESENEHLNQTERRTTGCAIAILVVAVAYVLSIGPMVWLFVKLEWEMDYIEIGYFPILYLCTVNESAKTVCIAYLSLWIESP